MNTTSPTLPAGGRAHVLVTAALVVLFAGFALWSHQVHAQTSPATSVLEQIDLTEDAAKSALRAYMELRADYKDQAPAGSDAQTFAQALIARGALASALARHGFTDTNTWYRTLTSFIIAHSAGVDGKMAEMQKSMQQLRDTPNLPEATKEQMIAQLSALLPSEQNVEVAKSVASDPEFASIIEEIRN